MSALILLVEDDPALLTLLQASVSYGGFTSESVASGRAALDIFRSRSFDAVLVDLGLPDLDGGEVLRKLREMSDVPILVVSGRDSERDKIDALDRGADDYIPKPFLPGELLARIRAALRRHQSQGASKEGSSPDARDPIWVGALKLDPFHRTAELRGRTTVLSDAEFKILCALATSGEDVVSKSALLKTLYDSDAAGETRIVEVYISNIRRKLRSIEEEEVIFNVRGRGWKIVIPAT
ncbi:response regulator transcription factor [Sphingosinicella terrae]|uniref:response regulator transcription factor n=1 Tax=Sphingosinicella terrae TaxID=2172047 RepID=UPI000E0D2345|nr:response regulator transcription factor [Sphingosinicella terrae]